LMAGLSAREAAEQVGLTKQAIIKAIRKGTISAQKDLSGEWRIDPAELFRVYQPTLKVDTNNQQPVAVVDHGLQREVAFRDEKIALLEGQVADLREDRDRWRAQAEQATRLLTDQRPARRRKWWPWRG
jgi:hypothetical protein